jgi:fructosamine-3-kinase
VDKWLKQVKEELSMIYNKKPDSIKLDLHYGNIGETSDGKIVFFDPLEPTFE